MKMIEVLPLKIYSFNQDVQYLCFVLNIVIETYVFFSVCTSDFLIYRRLLSNTV